MKSLRDIASYFMALLVACSSIVSCNGQKTFGTQYLKLEKVIPLPGVKGRIDHLAIDFKNQIVYVAAVGNNTLEVVDLEQGVVIHSITGLSEPQGVEYIPQGDEIFVANGGNGECNLFNAKTYQKTNTIQLSGDADNVRYDTTTKKIYAGYGEGGIAVIDATNFKFLNEIKLDGHPESFQIDNSSNQMYVNVPDEKQIEVIDLEKNIVIDKWEMGEATSNFPMALDNVNHRLFIGCRHPAKLLVIDTQTGKTISGLDIEGDTDDIFYNSNSKEIFVSCGSGYVNVFKQTDANTYISNGKISTRAGARTSLFIPELNQLIVVAPSRLGKEAGLFVYNVE